MKKFKFKFSTFVWVLLSVVLTVCLAGLALNVYNLTEYTFNHAFKFVSFALYTAITLFLTALVLSVMLFSNYVLKNDCLYVRFGFFRSKTKASDIVGITHFKKSDKLVVYFKHQAFSVIVISRDKYDEFVLSLRELNKSITFNNQIDGEDVAN